MYKILLSLSFVGVALSSTLHGRVVNGTDADKGEYPYVVSLIRISIVLNP